MFCGYLLNGEQLLFNHISNKVQSNINMFCPLLINQILCETQNTLTIIVDNRLRQIQTKLPTRPFNHIPSFTLSVKEMCFVSVVDRETFGYRESESVKN